MLYLSYFCQNIKYNNDITIYINNTYFLYTVVSIKKIFTKYEWFKSLISSEILMGPMCEDRRFGVFLIPSN